MQLGPLSENHLKNGVFSNIRKQNKGLKSGAAIGVDFSNMDGIIFADGTGKSPVIAWNKALNNFACSGAVPEGVRITMLLSEKEKQSTVSAYMKEFARLSEAAGIQILGGHSEVIEDCKESHFLVHVYGKEGSFLADKKAIKAECDIMMAGFLGVLGTNLIIDRKYAGLTERFSENYIAAGRFDDSLYSIKEYVNLILENEKAFYFHDVSNGGVFTALWQLGAWADKGFEIDCRKIKVKQETVEFCEAVDLNPYLIDGTGAVLFICERGGAIKKLLEKQGYTVEIIGKITDSRERIIILNENDRRTLAPNMTSDNI